MPSVLSKNHWIIKYKLYHLPFWALYHYIWWSVYGEGALEAASNILKPPYTVKYLFYVVFQAVGVYFCLYYLISRFLEKGKYIQFVGMILLTLSFVSLIIMSGYFIGGSLSNSDFKTLFNVEANPFIIFKNNTFPSSLASMTLGMSIKLSKSWLESQKLRQEMEKEKLATELKFLKSQYNPHFLFNTINSIFVLINKNTDMASESLAKFSGLLRYQLYECNESQIPLNRELLYLENFIELEKLRQNENFEVKTNLLPDYRGSLSIAPFILMPFIENAFKHVSQKTDQLNWIKIDLKLQDDQLCFLVSNSCYEFDMRSREAVSYGGLGLKNVNRRLDLLYPQLYELSTKKEEEVYYAKLKLTLSKQNLTQILPTASQKAL